MSRYRLPDPICDHVPTVRVSSHVDLSAAQEGVASTYCCDRPACRTDATEWVQASTHRPDVHVVPLRRKEAR